MSCKGMIPKFLSLWIHQDWYWTLKNHYQEKYCYSFAWHSIFKTVKSFLTKIDNNLYCFSQGPNNWNINFHALYAYLPASTKLGIMRQCEDYLARFWLDILRIAWLCCNIETDLCIDPLKFLGVYVPNTARR